MLLALAVARGESAPAAAGRVMRGAQGVAMVLEVDSGRLLACTRPDLAARRLVRPGSTLKPFALLALVNTGRVRTPTAQVCPRRLRVAGRVLDCSHPVSPLPLDATAALAYSCNCFFASAAAGMPAGELPELLNRLGLTSATGLMAGEAAGWARRPAGSAQVVLQALGEAGVEVTPLAMAEGYRKLALRRKTLREPDEAMDLIYAGLEAATEYGTARLANPPDLPFRVAGKTGTSTGAGPVRHAWFAGFAPARDPRFVVLVYLEHGSGGRDAAPRAGELFRALLK